MKHDFLVCPHLNQAFEPEGSSGGGWGNGITRRSFIKRTGGATVASLVAWNLSNERAQADVVAGGVSYFLKCTGDPHSNPAPDPVKLSFPFGDVVLKLSATCVGPHKGNEADSFSYSGTDINAKITCAAGTLQSGGNSFESWKSYTHTIWLDSNATTQEKTATPTPEKKLSASYNLPAGGFVSIVWNVSTEVERDLLVIKTSAVMARYESSTGLLMIHADVNTIETEGLTSDAQALRTVFPVVSPPNIRRKWRTGRQHR